MPLWIFQRIFARTCRGCGARETRPAIGGKQIEASAELEPARATVAPRSVQARGTTRRDTETCPRSSTLVPPHTNQRRTEAPQATNYLPRETECRSSESSPSSRSRPGWSTAKAARCRSGDGRRVFDATKVADSSADADDAEGIVLGSFASPDQTDSGRWPGPRQRGRGAAVADPRTATAVCDARARTAGVPPTGLTYETCVPPNGLWMSRTSCFQGGGDLTWPASLQEVFGNAPTPYGPESKRGQDAWMRVDGP